MRVISLEKIYPTEPVYFSFFTIMISYLLDVGGEQSWIRHGACSLEIHDQFTVEISILRTKSRKSDGDKNYYEGYKFYDTERQEERFFIIREKESSLITWRRWYVKQGL